VGYADNFNLFSIFISSLVGPNAARIGSQRTGALGQMAFGNAAQRQPQQGQQQQQQQNDDQPLFQL